MSIASYPSITSVHQSLNSTGTMASKRVGSKDTVESSTADVVEQGSMSLPVYIDKHLFIKKDIKITC